MSRIVLKNIIMVYKIKIVNYYISANMKIKKNSKQYSDFFVLLGIEKYTRSESHYLLPF